MITTPAVGLADTLLYLYDLDHRIVGEYGPTGAADIKAEYIWTLPQVGASGPTGGDDGAGGYMPLATAVGQTGALNWVHGHHLGTPILTTNAAGQAITPTGTAILGFPGQFANALLLSGAQHYYNRYRDYNFATGRYIQADPIGLAGDDNPYAYAAGNPLKYVDPSGEFVWLLPILGGAAIGAGSDLAFQAAMNFLQGREVLNWRCYDWGQVAISGGLGAISGGAGAWLNRGAKVAIAAEEIPTWTFGQSKSAAKWAAQMERRGWTPTQIDEAIASGERFLAPNKLNPANGARRFVHPETGRSVVLDSKTGELIHVGGDGFRY